MVADRSFLDRLISVHALLRASGYAQRKNGAHISLGLLVAGISLDRAVELKSETKFL